MAFIRGIQPHAIVGVGYAISGSALDSASSAKSKAGWEDGLAQEPRKLKEEMW